MREPMHEWNVPLEEAVALQQRLRTLVQQEGSIKREDVRTVAGIDASYRDVARAAVVVLAFPDMERLDEAVAARESVFPYVPGLLSFREGPVVLDALAKLTVQPDLLIFDGQGYAHPRRFGLASHLGVYLDRPSIGCAKSRLIGSYNEPGPEPGDRTPLLDRGEVIGAVLRTKARTKPLFISVGHKIDLETAVEVVLRCLRGYRLPEPTRLAHNLADAAARQGLCA
ncbi:MAG TPA: deoxyribonuclease V [Ktedonobacterales bacterium]|nr:deoxyribonuclease V [Ktedonobacterales bacterium]